MTSASELFFSRRHRLGRSNDLHQALDPSPVPDLHHHHHHHHHRHRRNRHHARRLSHHPSSTERAADRLGWRYNRSLLNDGDDSAGNVRGIRARGPRVNPTDTLPVGVLLARARLVERLRGQPVSTIRQYDRDLVGRDQESESSSDFANGDSLVTDLASQMERSHLLQELNKKPPGLTQEALDCLHMEVFGSRGTRSEPRELQDCGICLESFVDGDELIHLPCGHKFHSACLDPWVRCCGDCPYCRRGIVVDSNLKTERGSVVS